MFNQLSTIASVLGGFSLAFVGTILSIRSEKKVTDYTFVFSLLSTVLFIVCAVSWGLFDLNPAAAKGKMAPGFAAAHRMLSILFLSGTFTLLVCLGACGWIRSRRMGIVSMLAALLGFLALFSVLSNFIN